jgi:hypothetical protein
MSVNLPSHVPFSTTKNETASDAQTSWWPCWTKIPTATTKTHDLAIENVRTKQEVETYLKQSQRRVELITGQTHQ